jgi:hypothetical protein
LASSRLISWTVRNWRRWANDLVVRKCIQNVYKPMDLSLLATKWSSFNIGVNAFHVPHVFQLINSLII